MLGHMREEFAGVEEVDVARKMLAQATHVSGKPALQRAPGACAGAQAGALLACAAWARVLEPVASRAHGPLCLPAGGIELA